MLLNLLKTSIKASHPLFRQCSGSVLKEYTVSPTCNLNVVLSFNTVIKPVDISNPESDKVIISCNKILQCNQIGDSVNISSAHHHYDKDVTCEIQAPIRSNFNVTSVGNISISDFQGAAIRLFSENGNVCIKNSRNEIIAARAHKGNIITEGTVEAYKVELKTRDKGNIIANKIKCLGLKAETADGDISTKSCYSEQSYFVTKNGKLSLDNIHKHCKIIVENEGDIKMTGFDGILELRQAKGRADIHISNLTDRSEIEVIHESNLVLRLGDLVLENSDIRIVSKLCGVEDDIPHEENEETDTVRIKPKFNKECVNFKVICPKSIVTVKAASWTDMMQKRVVEAQANTMS